MPIEILPEGYADWYEPSSTPNIQFLEVDPFWKTKTGTTDPDNAILYRGGDGFLQRSTNGGVGWHSILPSTNPPWYEVADFAWWTDQPPMPSPVSGLAQPGPSQLNYRSMASNPAHSGEHSVLVTHSIANGISDGNDTINTLYTAWILYTTNDWLTHGWRQIIFDMDWRYREASVSAWDDVQFRGAASQAVTACFRISSTKAAVFVGGTCYNVSWSGSAWSLLGSASGGGDITQGNSFYYGGSIWGANVTPFSDTSSPYEFYWEVFEWDVSGSTPSYVGVSTSAAVEPDFTPTLGTAVGVGQAFHMTATGKLCLYMYLRDTQSAGNYQNEQREWRFNTFDTGTSSFGTPYKFYSGQAQANNVPWAMTFTGETLDSDKFIVFSLENNDWTNRSTTGDWYGYVNIMEAGTWKVPSSGEQILSDLLDANGYVSGRGNAGSKLFSTNRFGFVFGRKSGGVPVMRWNFVEYTVSPDTVTHIPWIEVPFSDYGAPINSENTWAIQNDSVGIQAFAGDEVFWSDPVDPDSFPHKAETYSEQISDVWDALAGNFTTYIRARTFQYTGGSGLGYYLQMSTGTYQPKYADYHRCRRHLGKMCWDIGGNYLYIPTKDMYYYTDDTRWDAYVERMERQTDGTVDYDTGFFGLQWSTWAGYVRDVDVPDDFSLNMSPWPKYTDAVLFYGNPYGVEFPSDPDQIYGYRQSAGYKYIWGANSFLEPCRGVIYTGGKLYAVTKGASYSKFYREKATADESGGDDMEYVSDITALPDPGLGTIDADDSDNAIAIAGIAADLVMVVLSSPPYSSWTNITYSHRNDRGVTGLKVID